MKIRQKQAFYAEDHILKSGDCGSDRGGVFLRRKYLRAWWQRYAVSEPLVGRGLLYGSGYFLEHNLSDAAKLTNELCGKAYLREHPEHVVYSDEWLAETYGICDENMPQGITAEEFRNRFSERGLMQMKRFCGLNNNGEIWLFDPRRMLDAIHM